ncbi:ArsR family transcriptional regulator [Blastococcus sp. TF02A-35]|jgi:predicted ArsR family transcriptional regulator|nr:ArsR family transcriptional regulator [Blastococcus sp. TF02A_35]
MEERRTQPRAAETARAGVRRQHVLDLLRSAPAGLGVQDLAQRTGLHPNTVRFHLDRLVADGLAAREAEEERVEPGRPRLTYTATPTPDPAANRRNYRFLAEILASYVSGTAEDPAGAAIETGRAWGHHLTDAPAPFERTSEQEAVAELLRILGDIGFAPELAVDDPRRILLPHCPFREVAEAQRQVICSIHLGLMRGALAEMRAPVTADRLLPFVEPSLCEAHLAPVGPESDADLPPSAANGAAAPLG